MKIAARKSKPIMKNPPTPKPTPSIIMLPSEPNLTEVEGELLGGVVVEGTIIGT